jgi:hypothetical protein
VTGNADAERERLAGPDADRWREWGPFVSERSWGTVREDYSADGEAWGSFTHDQARSRAYRWVEDGMAGVCDRRQGLCLALALWNGRDAILKERMFGLTGKQGNHGEDVKECWWYLDAVPSHAWLRWRYHYPQAAFPYDDLVTGNAARGQDVPELELIDTGVFDDGRFFSVEVAYAKAGPEDICMWITAHNHGPEAAPLHVLPQLWFRNTWSWGGHDGEDRPSLAVQEDPSALVLDHPRLGRWRAVAADASGQASGRWLTCENESNIARLWGTDAAQRSPQATPWPKDGIGDHVLSGANTVSPDGRGSKAACWFQLDVAAGATAEVRLRLTRVDDQPVDDGLGDGFASVCAQREREADEFHAGLRSADTTDDEALVMRQAFAGLLWCQQFYRFDVERWLSGDPDEPPPPAERLVGRNRGWRHLDANDVILMPDAWEYPWFASWDLAFHCVALAHLDPTEAKRQLLLLLREWYTHPNGQIPAYEWEFSDANPPVHAWAAVRVFELDGSTDHDFLARVFHKLLLNFSWWVNRKDAEGNNLFEGGFLGLDNIGPFNRSEPLPVPGVLEQSDGSGWMAMYCLNLLEMAAMLCEHDPSYQDVALKFAEHFAYIAQAMTDLWDDEDALFYDVIRRPDGSSIPVKVRSMVGVIPVFALTVLHDRQVAHMPETAAHLRWFAAHRAYAAEIGRVTPGPAGNEVLLSLVSPERLKRVLAKVLDPEEFLSDHGLRSLSRWHRDHPADVHVEGVMASVDYEPAESRSGLFGGNSNWRGPVWFPVNELVIEALIRYRSSLGPEFTVEHPTGSGVQLPLDAVAEDLIQRLVTLFTRDENGRRPVHGSIERFQSDPAWRDLFWFHEYFDGDTGAGLGASHQTGWTALVGHLIALRRFRGAFDQGDS